MTSRSPAPARSGRAAVLVVCICALLCVSAGTRASDQVDLRAELEEPATLTMWAWVPGIEKEVALFEKAHPNIQVKVVNVGQGPAEYPKLRTALKSGQGAPDVAQIEFQFIPSFVITGSLLDLSAFFPVAEFKRSYPEWVARQVVIDGHIWAIPQDTGPMGMLYRRDLLEQAGIPPPRTWKEFADAARAYHQKNPESYLTNLPPNEPAQWIGFFWQAGARPFGQPARGQLRMKLNDPAAKKVATFWEQLVKEGVVSTDPDWTDRWYQGLASGRYASWLTAAWGPVNLQGTAKKTSGSWAAAPLPQWSEGGHASGNWGGSTSAVLASTAHPAAAAELARWINQEHEPALKLATEQFLFPASNAILTDPAFIEQGAPFYGGQKVNKLFVEISNTVAKDFTWSPIHDFIASSGNDTFGAAIAKGGDMGAALDAWNEAAVKYAKEHGYKVVK